MAETTWKKILWFLLSASIALLTGCSHAPLSLPEGILATDQSAADEYISENPLLIQRYGADYTVTFQGGAGDGEVTAHGKSGTMTFQYIINGTEECDVEVTQEKGGPWTVTGALLCSIPYSCEEVALSFTSRSAEHYDEANGTLVLNGKPVSVIVSAGCSNMKVEDASLRQQYEADWGQFSIPEIEAMRSEEKQRWAEREKACTIFTCSVVPQFDSFTATLDPEYQGCLGEAVSTLHFYEAK